MAAEGLKPEERRILEDRAEEDDELGAVLTAFLEAEKGGGEP